MLHELGHELTSHEEVRATMLARVRTLDAESVGLSDAFNRILRTDLVATENVPPFDNSAMDGYALSAAEIASANEDSPVTLPVVDNLAAGDAPSGPLPAGRALRIMTGAPIPAGADAVVPYELTRFSDTEVTFSRTVKSGQNIRRAGGDMQPGQVPVGRGMRLRGPQIAVAATLGAGRLDVSRRPRVAILSPGKELVEPWEQPGPGQIRSSNAYALAALIEEWGGVADHRGIQPDDPEAIREAIARAIADGADMLLSSGGVSAGDFDYVQTVVREDARPGHVFKTAMRPGKPQVFGLFDGVPLFGLPGNPAAAIISFTVFVRPALSKMLGEEPLIPEPFPVRFPSDFRYKKGRVFLLRARVEADLERGAYQIVKTGAQDSSFLTALASSNAIVELPADRDAVTAGESFPAQWIHPR